MLIFKGPPTPHQIRLVKANEHYHGCTSFPAFVNRSYYCVECETGYNDDSVKQHSCKGTKCKSCNRKTCPDYRIGTLSTHRCPECNGLFFGRDCVLFHRMGKACGKFRTCPKCQSRYPYNLHKRHTCGMAKCPSCQEVITVATHQCYIQPVEFHPSEGADDDDDETDRGDALANALFVYADIEAQQLEDRTFEANMLCYRTAIEDEIHCLRGRDCCLQFLPTLDGLADQPADNEEEDDDERTIIIIFHNLKGFDGSVPSLPS